MEVPFLGVYITEEPSPINKSKHRKKTKESGSAGAGRKHAMEKSDMNEFVDELRTDWRNLWRNRLDDKVRAEGIAKKDYSRLFVERGTVIMATRDFKLLDFFDIVQEYLKFDAEKAVPPNSTIGGWGKFVRNNIRKQKKPTRRFAPPKPTPKKGQQQKKGGRGWLHAKPL